MPKIEGAIITAEGAENANVKTNIIQAVSWFELNIFG